MVYDANLKPGVGSASPLSPLYFLLDNRALMRGHNDGFLSPLSLPYPLHWPPDMFPYLLCNQHCAALSPYAVPPDTK